MADEVKEEKPVIGNIQFKGGKASIITEEGEIPFDLNYIIGLVKKALKGSREGYYTKKIRECIKKLKNEGVDSVESVMSKIKALSAGSDVNREFLKHIYELLSKIKMFKNIRTTSEEEKKEEQTVEKSLEQRLDGAIRLALAKINPEWVKKYDRALNAIEEDGSCIGCSVEEILSDIDSEVGKNYVEILTKLKEEYHDSNN